MFKNRIDLLLLVFVASILMTACGGGGSGGDSPMGTSANTLSAGVVVDPYISGAVLQEVAADGTVIQRSSTGVSDARGHFHFPKPLTVGSVVEIKVGNRGDHVGVSNQVILRRKVLSGDSGDLIVSPLTTLLANGSTETELVDLLHSAGLNDVSDKDLYLDPMANLSDLTTSPTASSLSRLQAAMTVSNYLEAVNNQPVTVSDLNNATDFQTLTTLLDTVQHTLNASLFQSIKTQLATDSTVSNLTLGDFIDAAVVQNRAVVALVKSQLSANGQIDPTLIAAGMVAAANNMMTATLTQNHTSQGYTPPSLIGESLYANYCATCHGALAVTAKPGRSAAAIQSAINNIGAMSSLSSLTSTQIQAIANALPAAPVVGPGTPPDGTALYGTNCASCHGSLATTTKPGRSAAAIQSAINNVGAMGSLSSLTSAQIQAIASVLTAAPVVGPGTPPDGAALYASECAGCHGPLATTSKTGRTAAAIQTAINNNTGNMSFLTLTPAEIQTIADVLPPTPVVDPGTPPNGTTLYSSNCASCHGALATTTKPGRTATAIQSAINTVGAMSSLSSLTTAEVQAIADALPPAPVVDPGTPPDGTALYGTKCASCHNALASTTKAGRTATTIQTAINSVSAMGSLSSLTPAEVQAIADVLPAGSGGPDYSDCTACHSQPPNGSVFPNTAGAHLAHQAIGAIGTNCSICHSGATHNGTVELVFPAAYNSPGSVATENQDGTCSSIRCHGGITTPNWWTGTINLASDCTTCHVRPSTGRHGDHRSKSCTVCHNSSRMATHIGDPTTSSYEVTAASTIGGSGTSIKSYNTSTRSCVGCHDTETW
ncbi:c-type cytochrome [Geopsychrobacter electrodiphilus]|uniref:c-type cytochrome n=1 Tax=Geopsychrobacter electrodiphilus TaxID=225196 RepID=UPI00037AA235|nr:CxxxxCH/CxxCH domain-containing protein [Geopsychrobacter electrodiphilus]